MSKLHVDAYLVNHGQLAHFTGVVRHYLEKLVCEIGIVDLPSVSIKWGETDRSTRNLVIESGFLWDGLHADFLGLYHHSSMNTSQFMDEASNYTPPVNVTDLVSLLPVPPSKFRQVYEKDQELKWKGVVLALQNPGDRSIRSIAHPEQYYQWVEQECKKFGEDLLLKLHPWNKDEVLDRFKIIARRYGCTIARTDHKAILDCDHCRVFNSTFAFDCFVRGIPVVQCAPGYFWQTGATAASCDELNDIEKVAITEKGYELADYCAWNYMIHCKMNVAEWLAYLVYSVKQMTEGYLTAPGIWSWANSMLIKYEDQLRDDWPMPEHIIDHVGRVKDLRDRQIRHVCDLLGLDNPSMLSQNPPELA